MIKTLIECNIEANQKNNRGDTVLMKLCNFDIIDSLERKYADYSIFDILIQNGLDIDA